MALRAVLRSRSALSSLLPALSASAPAARFSSAAAEVATTLDWEKFGATVESDEGRREFGALRKAFESQKTSYASDDKAAATVDWDGFKKQLDPALVDQFKKAYDTIKLPKFSEDPELLKTVSDLKASFVELEKKAKTISENAAAKIVEIDEQLAALEVEKVGMSTSTIDEVLAADPKLAAEVDAEIDEGNWRP